MSITTIGRQELDEVFNKYILEPFEVFDHHLTLWAKREIERQELEDHDNRD